MSTESWHMSSLSASSSRCSACVSDRVTHGLCGLYTDKRSYSGSELSISATVWPRRDSCIPRERSAGCSWCYAARVSDFFGRTARAVLTDLMHGKTHTNLNLTLEKTCKFQIWPFKKKKKKNENNWMHFVLCSENKLSFKQGIQSFKEMRGSGQKFFN